MKKVVLFVILGVLTYGAYMQYVKHESPLSVFKKKKTMEVPFVPKTKAELKKEQSIKVDESKKLEIELELNKPVPFTSKSLYADQIRLTGIDKASNTCTIHLYKSSGTLSKTMQVRKILGKKGTIEVSLVELKEKSAVVSMVVSSNPKEQIELLK